MKPNISQEHIPASKDTMILMIKNINYDSEIYSNDIEIWSLDVTEFLKRTGNLLESAGVEVETDPVTRSFDRKESLKKFH